MERAGKAYDLDSFDWPRGNPGREELKSLQAHSKYHFQSASVLEPVHHKIFVLHRMEEAYHQARTSLPDDFLTHAHFLRAIRRLDNTSTPGYPFCLQKPTIGEWFDYDGMEYNPMKVEEMWRYVRLLIDDNTDDLILSVFIKQEPHKLSKILDGRWRLIMGFPLHHQILWHMLFGCQNDKLVEKALHIPSQQGFMTYHGEWKHFVKVWKQAKYDVSLDKRAWDWTVSWWMLSWELEFRGLLISGRESHKQQWCRLTKYCYERAFSDPTLLLSNGSLYKQVVPGVMKSGCVNTISTNSFLQVMIHIMVTRDVGLPTEPLPAAVGDDTRHQLQQIASTSEYSKYGVLIKEIVPGNNFVGMDFAEDGPTPLYTAKHLFKACSISITEDKEEITQYLDSMMRLYVYSEDYYIWVYMAHFLGIQDRFYSREYYHRCFDCWIE
nr:RNA-dependent RNA polymerase [Solemoviridae sp.]